MQERLAERDPRVQDVVWGHAGLEAETDIIFQGMMRERPAGAAVPFRHQLTVIDGLTADPWLSKVILAVRRYIDLRNVCAHANSRAVVQQHVEKVCDAMGVYGPRPDPVSANMATVAIVLCSCLHIGREEREALLQHHIQPHFAEPLAGRSPTGSI